MSVYKSPSGITEPQEIHIEAIAQYCGALILYEQLDGCAARILGNGNEAIITVDDRASLGRRRFSAAHELGHWMRDREKIRFSCTEQAMQNEWGAFNPEQGANQYAADLLLPKSMFVPAAKGKPLTLDSASELGAMFRTSLTATAIHLLRYGSFPGMLIYTQDGKRKWFMRGEDVHECLWPHERPLPATFCCRPHQEGLGDERAIFDTSGWLDQSSTRALVRSNGTFNPCFANRNSDHALVEERETAVGSEQE
jgi:Zn-dependent peptidase ImmA (M78 family)